MDRFLSHLVYDLDLENFGVTYEDLVPVTCSLKWTQNTEKEKNEFVTSIMRYLLRGSKVDEGYLDFQSKITSIVDLYWKDIVYENKHFNQIRIM